MAALQRIGPSERLCCRVLEFYGGDEQGVRRGGSAVTNLAGLNCRRSAQQK